MPDPLIYTHEGVQYLAGTAGSLILACPKCGEEHFRDFHYFYHPEWAVCFTCKPKQQMEPILISELESRWKPFWRSLGLTLTGEAESETPANQPPA